MRIAPTDWRNALSPQRKHAGSSGERGNAGRCEDGRRLTSLIISSRSQMKRRGVPGTKLEGKHGGVHPPGSPGRTTRSIDGISSPAPGSCRCRGWLPPGSSWKQAWHAQSQLRGNLSTRLTSAG